MDEPFDDSCETWTVKHGRPLFIMDVYCKLWTLMQKYGRHLRVKIDMNYRGKKYKILSKAIKP